MKPAPQQQLLQFDVEPVMKDLRPSTRPVELKTFPDTLETTGEAIFKDKSFQSLSRSDRLQLVLDYLSKQDVVLNHDGRIHLLNSKKLSELERRLLKKSALSAIEGLFYHCPEETMKAVFQVIPSLAGPVKNSAPIVNPGNSSTHKYWTKYFSNLMDKYPHTEAPVLSWIDEIKRRALSNTTRLPRTAISISHLLLESHNWREGFL